MSKVLAAGSHAVLSMLPALDENAPLQRLVNGASKSGPWKDSKWDAFFRARGAALLLQEDIIMFLLSPEIPIPKVVMSPLYLKFETENAHDPSTIGTFFLEMINDSKKDVPEDLKVTLEIAARMLSIIRKPDLNSPPWRAYDNYIRVRSTLTSRSRRKISIGKGRGSPMEVGYDSRQLAARSSRRQSLRSADSLKQLPVKRPSSSGLEQDDVLRGDCKTPPRWRPGESLADFAYDLW